MRGDKMETTEYPLRNNEFQGLGARGEEFVADDLMLRLQIIHLFYLEFFL